MTMTYTSLTAAKGISGSLANWVSYTLLDLPTILDEAQTLIYQTLRTREMRTSATLSLSSAASSAALPNASTGQFLEPLVLRDDTASLTFIPNDERFVSQKKLTELRVYTASVLATGIPGYVAIFDEAFQFDVKASGARTYTLIYYKRPDLLAATSNESNWLTYRYPHILRAACIAAAADFKQDDEEYKRALARLAELIAAANAEVGNTEGMGVGAKINSDPAVEGSLLSFLSSSTVPVQAVLAEAQALIFARLRVREMRVSTTLTLNSAASSVSLPDASTGQFLETVSLHDDTSGRTLIPNDERYVSDQRMLQIRQYSAGVLTTGTPAYVSVFDESFQFDVKATATTTLSLVYYKRPADLTSAASTSFLTYRYPQILRTAAQAAQANFQRDGELYAKLLQELYALIDAANQEAALLSSQGLTSGLNQPNVEGSLLSLIPSSTPPVQSVLKEAQTLIYSLLRVREMRTLYRFKMSEGMSFIALPTRFLDPIGRIYIPSLNLDIDHKDENYVLRQRTFEESTATLGASPITTASGSTQITIALTSHGFGQGSVFTISGAAAVGGITPNGTFEIVSIDTDSFVVETGTMTATSTATGGGSAVVYVCENLIAATPSCWAIWNERIYFDCAFSDDAYCELEYFQSLPLITASSDSNFLTERYPQVLRAAAQAASAGMRQQHQEYDLCMTRVRELVQATAIEADLVYRGVEIQTYTP